MPTQYRHDASAPQASEEWHDALMQQFAVPPYVIDYLPLRTCWPLHNVKIATMVLQCDVKRSWNARGEIFPSRLER